MFQYPMETSTDNSGWTEVPDDCDSFKGHTCCQRLKNINVSTSQEAGKN